MSLTVGRAPFGQRPAGHFDFEPPSSVTWIEPFSRRVRGIVAGRAVIDSNAVVLVHETGHLPHYAFPAGDVEIPSEPEPAVPGHVRVGWGDVEQWFEEDEQVQIHVRDPYTRIDCLASSRRVRVTVDDVVLGDSTTTIVLYETSLPPRFYLPQDHVRMDLLGRSATETRCPYKGTAMHWTANVGGRTIEDIGWTYEDPYAECRRIAGRICFYDQRANVEVDPPPHE